MKDNQNKRRKLTDEQVEQMLARAVQKNVPDILQQAASTPVTPLAMVDEILPVQYPRRCPHWQRLAAACLMLLLTGAGIFSWLWFPTRAVVSIEVNPSVALSLNRFSYVINTRANNDDGAELLDDLSLNNLKLDTALNALIGAMDRQGYLTPSAQVNIFVDGKDDDYNRQLYQQVTDSFSHLLSSQSPQEETKEQENTQQLLLEEQVKQICLSHAGVQAAQTSFQSISLQQGEQPVYQLCLPLRATPTPTASTRTAGRFSPMSAPRKQPRSKTHLPLLLLPNRRQSRNRFRWSRQNSLPCKKPD